MSMRIMRIQNSDGRPQVASRRSQVAGRKSQVASLSSRCRTRCGIDIEFCLSPKSDCDLEQPANSDSRPAATSIKADPFPARAPKVRSLPPDGTILWFRTGALLLRNGPSKELELNVHGMPVSFPQHTPKYRLLPYMGEGTPAGGPAIRRRPCSNIASGLDAA